MCTTSVCRPELIDRIAQFINQYVTKVCGSKAENYRLPVSLAMLSSLAYDPKQFLFQFVKIYAAGAKHDRFVRAVGIDGGGYSREEFIVALRLVEDSRLPADIIQAFKQLLADVEAFRTSDASHLEELGEVPEEFCDPISCTIMSDPVCLPSGIVMDRAVITRHLLNKSCDPFSRQPLCKEDLVDNIQLKARIDAFVQQAKQRTREKDATSSTTLM